MNLGLLIFIAAILIVVMIHESGHFFVAKAFNFKATKYFVGFGPTIWSTTKGETEYGIKALPLGGFVKIVGMNPYEEIPPEDQPRSYPNKPIWQRALVIVAGSATHFVVAFLILLVTVMTIGWPTDRASTEVAGLTTRIMGEPAPAGDAGFLPGDQIIAADGQPLEEWRDVRNYIRSHRNAEVTFTVLRDGREVDLTTRLGSAIIGPDDSLIDYAPPGGELDISKVPVGGEIVGFLGVEPDRVYVQEGLVGGMGAAASQTWAVTKLSLVGIQDMFGMVFGGELWDALQGEGEREVDEGPLGIVGAGRIASESVESGHALDLIGLIVGFTVFVGLMNLLPLPP
ncbi:MAG: M50 family metallopeptidase, partial [Actinomycetota bacterium]